jgi:hypothetical protein
MSTSTEYMDGLNAPAERRFYPRVTPPTPIYVAFGPNNLGVLHNVSENGFQVTTPNELPLNSVYRVFLSLNGASKTIAVTVRTIWTENADKRSGIQLLDLADEDRDQIRRWVEFEMSRSETSPPWFLPKSSAPKLLTQQPTDDSTVTGDRQTFGAVPSPRFKVPPSNEPQFRQPQKNAEHIRAPQYNGQRFKSAFATKIDASSTPPPAAVPPAATPASEFAPNVTESTAERPKPNPIPPIAPPPPSASMPRPAAAAPAPTAQAPVAEANEADLPKIANPFDHPDPNAQFNSPFPKVPLPIHGEFEYAAAPPKRRRRSGLSSHMHARPLIVWAAVLALVCFGANALVRYKIKRNSQRFASESAKYVPPKSDAARPDSTTSPNDSDANSAAAPSVDTQPSTSSTAGASSAPSTSSSASATSAQNDSGPATIPSASRSLANGSNSAPAVTRHEPASDALENGAYTATAPPASRASKENPVADSQEMARASQSAPTPRSWAAPAPNRSASSSLSASDAPQSPNVTNSSNSTQSSPAPIVSQTRPAPPPAPATQAPGRSSTPSSVSPSTSSNNANSAPATQQPSNSQPSTYASNTNTAQSRSQSQIYNANAPQQRSAIIGSINSVHSSGIFDSHDTTTASAAPPTAASRSNNANSNGAARNVGNNSVIPSDTPQEKDLEIVAPKGFNASWVDVPGEHVVRTSTATIRMRRLIRVPGERIPGQRWLWRGHLNVSLGDVVNRIDPSVVQASGASGSLTVQATIDKDGYVTDLKPLYGNFAMLPSVSRAVRNWHYEPTYLDNKRAETQAQIEFDLRPTASSSRTTHP